jgi:sugar O-acyltransferase (sialic acid O-acetyltransferase NeuD family)
MALVIFGARRQCAHVLNLLEWSGEGFGDVFLFDNAYPEIQGPRGLAVTGKVPDGIRMCVEQNLVGLVAMGTRAAAARYEVYRAAKQAGVRLGSVKYDCRLAPSVTHGDNVVMMPGSVIGPDVQIGSLVMMFSGVVIEHDGKIGDNVTFGPGVVVSGEVKIRSHSFLGAGCVVKPGVEIGEGCLIGAGSVVCRDCHAGWVMVGVPAHPLREVKEGDDAPTLGFLEKFRP